MMPYAIFNRLSTNALLVGKFIVFAFFIGTIVLPLTAAHAASYTCYKSTIGETAASLTIGTISSSSTATPGVQFVLSENNSVTVIHAQKVSPTSVATQKQYDYTGLRAGRDYRVIVLNRDSGYVETIESCNFATTNMGAAPATKTTPGAAETVQPTTTTTTATGGTVIPAGSTALNIPEVTVGAGGSGLIPCDGAECDLNSFLQLANNVMAFFFRTLLLPIFVVMVMYLGYTYLTANGNPAQHGKVASMAKHMVLGLLLMLCAWVIVRGVLSMIGYQDDLFFFGK